MEEIAYGTAPLKWNYNEIYGNHRFIVEAPAAEYVRVSVPWRRRDPLFNRTAVIVRYNSDGNSDAVGDMEIKNVVIDRAEKESLTLVFSSPRCGKYQIYYMPFELTGHWCSPETHYLTADRMTPDKNWLDGMSKAGIAEGRTLRYESRTGFDSFYPMEFTMTPQEKDEFFASGKPFEIVTESRLRPVRMKNDLPFIWKDRKDRTSFSDTVCKNEHYAFQIAVCAVSDLSGVSVTFYDKNGAEYGKDRVFSINTYAVDTDGRPSEKECSVPAGSVQPLWCCVDAEKFDGEEISIIAKVSAENVDTVLTASVDLKVSDEELPRNGDDDLWRHSRLFWLNSDVGISDDVIPPYTPVITSPGAGTVSILVIKMRVGTLGLPSVIGTYYDVSGRLAEDETPLSLLSDPIAFKIRRADGPVAICEKDITVTPNGTMRSVFSAIGEADGLSINSEVSFEADGFIDCTIKVTPEKGGEFEFILSTALFENAAQYMMGMCREGGKVPAFWEYRWREDRDGNVVWLGCPRGGLQIRLMQDDDHWGGVKPLPESWSNGGRGKITVRRLPKEGKVVFSAETGKMNVTAGRTVTFHFHMIVTPLHSVDHKSHFTKHYYQSNSWHSDEPVVSLERAKEYGASTVILHQGGPLNENINYPFYLAGKLKSEVDRAHSMGLKYKIYYTVRELSNYTTEIWALRSLGDEIYYTGTDFRLADFFESDENKVKDRPSGGPWLIEHLSDGFCPAWHQPLSSGEYDCAVRTQHRSRWHNYYLKGLEWLMTVVGIDGIYLDGIGYNRHITRRLRRIMKNIKEDCDIDIHLGNEHSPFYGYRTPTCDYLEHFAYADKIWVGEGYDYQNEHPDYFLTEISGLPLGLTSEMLEGGGNPWRGMVFGMTTRAGWSQGGLTLPIWKVWDSFGIADSRMFGYWDPDCPISTENDSVRATAFVKDNGETLIAVASWLPTDRDFILSVDRDALGINGDFEFYAPPIEGFQEEATFPSGEPVPIPYGKGWMFILRKR